MTFADWDFGDNAMGRNLIHVLIFETIPSAYSTKECPTFIFILIQGLSNL